MIPFSVHLVNPSLEIRISGTSEWVEDCGEVSLKCKTESGSV